VLKKKERDPLETSLIQPLSMSGLLLRWFNSLGANKVENIEHDFSDGFAFGSLLCHFNIMTQSELGAFQTKDDDIESRVNNFDLLETFLVKDLGIIFDPEEIAKIIRGGTSAVVPVSTMLFKMKCYFDPESAPLNRKIIIGSNGKFFDERQPVKRVPLPDPALVAISQGRLNKKQRDIAIHLGQFEESRIRQEKEEFESQIKEQVELAEIVSEIRLKRIENLKKSREFQKEWLKQGMKDWKKNQDVKTERVRKELEYELTCWNSNQATLNKIRYDHSKLVETETDSFETNMKRQGFEKQRTKNSVILDFETAIKEATEKGKKESDEYLARLKRQRIEALVQTKKREQRRRKMIVDQTQNEANDQEIQQHQRFMEKANEKSVLESEVAHSRRRRRHQMTHEKKNILHHCCKLAETQNNEFIESLKRDRRNRMENSNIESKFLENGLDGGQKLSDGEEGEILKVKTKKVEPIACDAVVDTVSRLIDMVFQVIDNRNATDSVTPIEPEDWKRLTQRFVEGVEELEESPVENSKTFEVQTIAKDMASIESFPMNEMCACLNVLTSQDKATLQFEAEGVVDGGIMVVGDDMSMVVTHIVHSYLFKTFSITALIEEATVHEGLVSKKKKGELVLDNIEDRDSLLCELNGELKTGEESLALVKLLVFDLRHSENTRWLVYSDQKFSSEQMQLLEFLLQETDLTFEDFKISPFKSSIFALITNEDIDSINEASFPVILIEVGDPRVVFEKFEYDFSSLVGTSESILSGNKLGLKMARRWIEAEKLPSGVINTYDMGTASSLEQVAAKLNLDYNATSLLHFSNIVKTTFEIETLINQVCAAGEKVVTGIQPPSDIESPQVQIQQLLRHFSECTPNEDMENKYLSSKSLCSNLWKVCKDYSKIADAVLTEWQSEHLCDSLFAQLFDSFANQVEIEIQFYCDSRKLIKDFFSSFEMATKLVVPFEGVRQWEPQVAQILEDNSQQTENFLTKLKLALRTVERRESRVNTESPNDALTVFLLLQNENFKSRLQYLVEKACFSFSRFDSQLKSTFANLDTGITNQITCQDSAIRKLKKDLLSQISSGEKCLVVGFELAPLFQVEEKIAK